jgi:hypothetical protein
LRESFLIASDKNKDAEMFGKLWKSAIHAMTETRVTAYDRLYSQILNTSKLRSTLSHAQIFLQLAEDHWKPMGTSQRSTGRNCLDLGICRKDKDEL